MEIIINLKHIINNIYKYNSNHINNILNMYYIVRIKDIYYIIYMIHTIYIIHKIHMFINKNNKYMKDIKYRYNN